MSSLSTGPDDTEQPTAPRGPDDMVAPPPPARRPNTAGQHAEEPPCVPRPRRPPHPGSSALRRPFTPSTTTALSPFRVAQAVKTGPVPQRATAQPTTGKVSGATP